MYAGQPLVPPASSAENIPLVYAGQPLVPPASAVPPDRIPSAPGQTGAGQYAVVLAAQIMDLQRHIQNLQEQMQICMLRPGPGAAQQVFDLQRQGAVAQGALQQLLLQYSQLLLAESTTPMMCGAQPPTAGPSSHPTSSSAPLPSDPAVNDNQVLDQALLTLPLDRVPSVSASVKMGHRHRTLSQTLDEMQFEAVTVPPPPFTTEGPGLIVSGHDAFSKMGNKPRSKRHRSKTPAPSGNTPGLVISAHDAFSKMGTGPANDTSRTLKSEGAANADKDMPIDVDDDVFREMGESKANNAGEDMPVDVHEVNSADKDMHVDVGEMPVNTQQSPQHFEAPPPSPTVAGPLQRSHQTVPAPDMAQAFPGLPPFNTTNMSLEEFDLELGDLTVLPEELQQMLQEREPLVDNKGGRPSSQTLKTIDNELATIDKGLARLSKSTGISVASIMKRWNTTKNRGGSLWNIYQRYFNAHKEDELARLGLDLSTVVTGKVRADAYLAFRDAYPTTWPEVLEVWAQYTEVEHPAKTLQQRSLQFRQVWRTLSNLVCISSTPQFFILTLILT